MHLAPPTECTKSWYVNVNVNVNVNDRFNV